MDRVLSDDCDVVRHLDGVQLVGGKISRGMGLERDAALDAGKVVMDWSRCTVPPADGTAISNALAEMIRTSYRAYGGPKPMEVAASHDMGTFPSP